MKLKWRDSAWGPSYCDLGGLNICIYPAGKGHWRIATGLVASASLNVFKGTKDQAKVKAVEVVRNSLKKILEDIG